MFIDLKFVPSSLDNDSETDNDNNVISDVTAVAVDAVDGSSTLLADDNVDDEFEAEESETLIKSEQAMRLAFPDSTVAEDAALASNVDPSSSSSSRFGDESTAYNPFDDEDFDVAAAAAAAALCPSGYAQDSHTRLVADPVKQGRHHDGRPRAHDPFVCYLCAKDFTEASGLFDHVRLMHSGVWTDSICPLCGKQLMDKTVVKQHFDLGM